MVLLLKPWLRPKPGHGLELETALALACVFQSQSCSKLGQSHGFQAKPGWHITNFHLCFWLHMCTHSHTTEIPNPKLLKVYNQIAHMPAGTVQHDALLLMKKKAKSLPHMTAYATAA
jgi:hypothetical protein